MRMMLGHPSVGFNLKETERFDSEVWCSERTRGVAVDSIALID